ncbi:MAG: elongation factor P [Proteobacteria bacterium]|nr:elongation factor P [Pseudomonadota bacterium]
MPTSIDLKKGSLLLMDGDPFTVLETTVQTPSARGGATLVKLKAKNIRTKQILQKTFKAEDRVEVPNFEIVPCQYLYNENKENYIFMNNETYEQFTMTGDMIEYELQFIRENDDVQVLLHDGNPIGLQIPNTVTLRVVECEPAIKGDTVTAATKRAKLETGLEVQVPLFIDQDTLLVIDTRDARYIKRA